MIKRESIWLKTLKKDYGIERNCWQQLDLGKKQVIFLKRKSNKQSKYQSIFLFPFLVINKFQLFIIIHKNNLLNKLFL